MISQENDNEEIEVLYNDCYGGGGELVIKLGNYIH